MSHSSIINQEGVVAVRQDVSATCVARQISELAYGWIWFAHTVRKVRRGMRVEG